MIVTDWVGFHRLSDSGYRNQYTDLRAQGYRLIKVSGYCENNQAQYAGVWYKRGGNSWLSSHGMSRTTYETLCDVLKLSCYRPTHVSVFTIGSQQFFSAIWEQEKGLPWIAQHDLTADEYQQLFNQLHVQGWPLRCVSGYEVGGEERYACIWDRYSGPGWVARHRLNADEYQRAFNELKDQGGVALN